MKKRGKVKKLKQNNLFPELSEKEKDEILSRDKKRGYGDYSQQYGDNEFKLDQDQQKIIENSKQKKPNPVSDSAKNKKNKEELNREQTGNLSGLPFDASDFLFGLKLSCLIFPEDWEETERERIKNHPGRFNFLCSVLRAFQKSFPGGVRIPEFDEIQKKMDEGWQISFPLLVEAGIDFSGLSFLPPGEFFIEMKDPDLQIQVTYDDLLKFHNLDREKKIEILETIDQIAEVMPGIKIESFVTGTHQIEQKKFPNWLTK